MAACNQAKTAFLKITYGQEVDITLGLPQLLNPESQDETFPVPDQAVVLAEQTF